jgi:Mrp family chromosome partitioning ATPase
VRVLGEIPPGSADGLRPGTLRRRDQEAFGRLLDELGDARLVLVSGDRERKRAAAAGLAAASAARGSATAIVDCDLAEPTLAEELGLARAPGLREYLLGEVEAARVLQPLALAGPGSGAALGPLVCVAGGRPASNWEALLGSAGFRHAMAGLRDANELVVAEGPPLPLEEGLLSTLSATADTTIACLERAGGAGGAGLPAAVGGVVLQAARAQRS